MNKKFSTLVAVLLAASVFSTVDAKVVTIAKGATPAAGSAFAIGTTLTAGTSSVLEVKTNAGTPASTVWSGTLAPSSVEFASASKWKFVYVNGANSDGGYYLQAVGGDGDGLYLSAEAKLVEKTDAVAVAISSTNIVQKDAASTKLTIASKSVSWGNGSALVLFSDGTTKVDLNALAAGTDYAIVCGSNETWGNASNTFVAVVTYTAATPDTYVLKKTDLLSAIADDSKDVWKVEAVDASDATKGFYLKTTEGYVGKTGTPLAVGAKADAQAFTYTANGELAAVGTSNELKWTDLSLDAAATAVNAVDIAFWQAEVAEGEAPTLPGAGDISIAEDGKTVNVDPNTDAIATPIYLNIAGEYLMVDNGTVKSTTDAPTAETALAYSWTMADGVYSSVAQKRADKADKLTVVLTKAIAGVESLGLATTGTELSFVVDGPSNVALAIKDGATIGSVTNSLAQVLNLPTNQTGLVTAVDADTYYLLSDGTVDKYVKVVSEGATPTAEDDKTSDYVLWKVTETKVTDNVYSYTFINKAGYKLIVGEGATNTYTANGKYTGAITLTNSKGVEITQTSDKPNVGGTATTWSLYEAAPKAYTAAELNKFEGAGFSMTIDVKKDAKATIKGADMFAGKLTAVETGVGAAAGKNVTYNLKTADGKYIVLLQKGADNAAWGTGSDMNGEGTYSRGYKFSTVKEIKADGKYLSNFSISHAAGSDSKDLIVEALKADNSVFGRLYIAKVDGEYLLTTTKNKAADDVYPYVVIGSSNTVKIKDIVKGGRFVNISYANSKKVTGTDGNLDRFGKVYTVGLNTLDQMVVSYAKLNTEVLASSPETQWAITGSDAAVTFSNREQPTVKLENVILYKTGTPDVYSVESEVYNVTDANGKNVIFRDTIRLSYVEDITKYDGFMFAKENQLRNQRYNLSAINQVGNVTQKMYWAENQGTHKIGLDGDVENAGKWKLSLNTKEVKVDGEDKTMIDTVLVISTVSIIKDDKVVPVADTLAILPYLFQNAENNEYVKYNDKSLEAGDFYICDKNKVKANATRFALKMRPDSTYHFVTLNSVRNAYNATAPYGNPFVNKLYAGSSTNLLNHVANYTVKGNDLMSVTPIDVPEYRQVAFGDTIRIYREENPSQVVYEKRDASVLVEGKAPSFLNIDNVNQFKDINPAIFVDTAYVNREAGENTRYQYLLAVNVEEMTDAVCPLNPEHNTQAWRDEHNNGKPCPDAKKSNYVRGRFLINLMDTANVYESKQLHSKNPYVDKNEAGEELAKLAFVEGYHLNDTLFIQRSNGKFVKLDMSTPDFNIAKFAFHYVNSAEGTFKIQTLRKEWKFGDLDREDEDDSHDGYLKWINGTMVVAEGFAAGDVFNLNEDETRIPTANDNINATSFSVKTIDGAVVIAGAEGKTVTITNVLGQTVASTVITSSEATISVPAGVVVVAVEGEAAVKAIVK